MSGELQAGEVSAALHVLRQALDGIAGMEGSQAKTDAIRDLAEPLQDLYNLATRVRAAELLRIHDTEKLSLAKLADRVGISKARADQIIRAAGRSREQVSKASTTPEPKPVVAAIVTSPRGVLIGRRNDGKPPWTFIAGEIESGESPADAAVREVKEEAGLRIDAADVIGRRVHPKTGRTMVYIAARPVGGIDAFVGDEDELAEVRWVSLAEADQLMGGTIFEPVYEHLGRVLRG
jgi:8-oxo-dGTP pyrophosphatase MutT (NUDIX family)